MASIFLTRSKALGSAGCQGARSGSQQLVSSGHTSNLCRCSMAGPSSAAHSSAGTDLSHSRQRTRSANSKYDRIAAFVDAHATPIVPASLSSVSVDFSIPHSELLEQPASWHNSYDEEAEEGELCDEPFLLAFTPTVSAQAAGHVAAMAVSTAAAAPAAAVSAPSWSYGDLENPKHWCYSWDEEAEGAFELADHRRTVQQSREQRHAAMHEARHAARLNRRMRRAQLHPQLGDLEHMQAWVGEEVKLPQHQQKQQRSVPSLQYQQLLALVAGDSAHRQYRKPKAWHLTFDEECHGDQPETVLGSC